jgi:hypothetical protein
MKKYAKGAKGSDVVSATFGDLLKVKLNNKDSNE